MSFESIFVQPNNSDLSSGDLSLDEVIYPEMAIVNDFDKSNDVDQILQINTFEKANTSLKIKEDKQNRQESIHTHINSRRNGNSSFIVEGKKRYSLNNYGSKSSVLNTPKNSDRYVLKRSSVKKSNTIQVKPKNQLLTVEEDTLPKNEFIEPLPRPCTPASLPVPPALPLYSAPIQQNNSDIEEYEQIKNRKSCAFILIIVALLACCCCIAIILGILGGVGNMNSF